MIKRCVHHSVNPLFTLLLSSPEAESNGNLCSGVTKSNSNMMRVKNCYQKQEEQESETRNDDKRGQDEEEGLKRFHTRVVNGKISRNDIRVHDLSL